jgi:hypothetical protein
MTPTPHASQSNSSNAPAIIAVSPEADEPRQGVVFWWSNILRGYQLRFYPPTQSSMTSSSAAPPPTNLPTLAHLPQIYLSRADVEAHAFALARHFGVEIYEIQIPHLNPAANQSD